MAPPPDPHTGALLAEQRTVVAVGLTRANQAAFGEMQGPRLPTSWEGGHEDMSGVRGLPETFVRREGRAAFGAIPEISRSTLREGIPLAT